MIEAFGFVTGAVNVWLLARQNIWNWPIGIANNLAYLLLFATSGLYGDAGLQVVYITLAIYGWRIWLRRGSEPGSAGGLAVTRTKAKAWMRLVPVTLLAVLMLRWFLARFTDSTVPGWDGLTTALSLAATYGQCRKLLESWWIWILADMIYIPLYVYKGLWLTSVLYFVFLLLCIFGLREWMRELPANQPSPTLHEIQERRPEE
jgi:nicotinamide mononucleotide transporter